tara:strand:+ start:126 stop:1652 length:1527 start_codon:yes stop_codon:yes gene_type:complete
MAEEVLYNRQWAKQDVMRTVTLGLAPYIPFSQHYVMNSRPKVPTAEGHIELLPKAQTSKTVAEIPYFKRQLNYFHDADVTPQDILNRAPPSDTKTLGQKLTNLLEQTIPKDSVTQRNAGSSVLGEILTEMGIKDISGTLNVDKPDVDASILGIKSKGLSTQTFDMIQGPATKELFHLMAVKTKAGFMKNVIALEETESKGAKALQQGLKTGDVSGNTEKFHENAKNTFGKINTILKKLNFKGLSGDNYTKKAREDPFFAGETYSRQVLDRAFRMISGGFGGKSYVYQVPLGDGLSGLVRIGTKVANGIPQILYNTQVIQVGGHGRMIEIIASGLEKLGVASAKGFRASIALKDIAAAGESISTAFRVGAVGQMQETTLESMLSPGADIQMSRKKGKGVMGLGSKAMGDAIGKQMRDMYSEQGSQSKFAQWYKQMVAKSNKVSDEWKRALDSGNEYGSASNQDAGVWKETGNNWDTDGKSGQDFSISPFLIVRRKGVASFREENKSKFL